MSVLQDLNLLVAFEEVAIETLAMPSGALSIEDQQNWLSLVTALQTDIENIITDWKEDIVVGLQSPPTVGDGRRRAIQKNFERGLAHLSTLSKLEDSATISRSRQELMKFAVCYENYLHSRERILDGLSKIALAEVQKQLP